jgi:hypothetical protein
MRRVLKQRTISLASAMKVAYTSHPTAMKTCLMATLGISGLIYIFSNLSVLNAAEPGTNPAAAGAAGKGLPKIQFTTNFFDFGKITASETISGAFEFKNVGDGILKVDPPQASCDCTEPSVKPDTLAPGETGKILYTIKLERALNGQRTIRVHSNDPESPAVTLTMQMDYTPLYEMNPKTLRIMVPAGKDEARVNFTVTRIDGKPLGIDRFKTSQEWISAAFDPSFKPEDSSGQVNITVRRPAGPPTLINAKVELWGNDQGGHPLQTLSLTGEIFGEFAAIPPRLYWVIPDFGKNKADYPAEALTRKIQLISILGHEVDIKSATSDLKGMNVQVVPKEARKTYDLVLKFDELPQVFTNTKVTIETSLASLPKIEVPLTISVPGGN